MTRPFSDLVIQRASSGSWHFLHSDVYGSRGGFVHVVDEKGNVLERLKLSQNLPGFDRHAHETTAGYMWNDRLLACFTHRTDQEGVERAIVCPWWGERLVIELRLPPCPPKVVPATSDLNGSISELITEGLRKTIADFEKGTEAKQTDLSCPNDFIGGPISYSHHAGLIQLREAEEYLRKLEAFSPALTGFGWVSFSDFSYHPHPARLAAQTALRRIGSSPVGHPALSFSGASFEGNTNAKKLTIKNGPFDGETKHSRVKRVKKNMPLEDLYTLIGAPDYIDRNTEGCFYWRYDIDATGAPFTLLIWLNDTQSKIERAVRHEPPFWSTGDLFSSRDDNEEPICPPGHMRLALRFQRTGPVLGSDNGTIWARTKQLDDGSFNGHQEPLELL